MKETFYPKKISKEKVVLTSFLVNMSDVFINLFAAVLSGSVVMLTQAIEGGADLLASGFLILGLRRAKLPSDKKHPFGYGREIYFWTFLSALATFGITAIASFYLGFERFLNPQEISSLNLTLFILTFSVITNGYSMSLSFKRLLGKNSYSKILQIFGNSALIETKTTFILDLIGTLASILGLFALLVYKFTGDLRFDGLGAMAIGVTLAFLAAFIIKGAKDLLVGQSAGEEIEAKIMEATLSFPQVKKVLDLRTLNIGTERLLINIEVHLSDFLTTDEIEMLIDRIEGEIKKEVPSASNIQIELETPDI